MGLLQLTKKKKHHQRVFKDPIEDEHPTKDEHELSKAGD